MLTGLLCVAFSPCLLTYPRTTCLGVSVGRTILHRPSLKTMSPQTCPQASLTEAVPQLGFSHTMFV